MFYIYIYLLESSDQGDSNKYLKCIVYEEIRIKQTLSYIILFKTANIF